MCKERVIERLEYDIDDLSSLFFENKRRINNINITIHRNRKIIKTINNDREIMELTFEKVRKAIGIDINYRSEQLFENKILEFENEKANAENEIEKMETEKDISNQLIRDIKKDIKSIINHLEKIKKETNELNH